MDPANANKQIGLASYKVWQLARRVNQDPAFAPLNKLSRFLDSFDLTDTRPAGYDTVVKLLNFDNAPSSEPSKEPSNKEQNPVSDLIQKTFFRMQRYQESLERAVLSGDMEKINNQWWKKFS